MNEYKIERDLQVLQSRIERLECACDNQSPEVQERHAGISTPCAVPAGVGYHHEPLHWKPEVAMQLPPILSRLLGVPERIAQFDVHPESKTWKEMRPLVLSVTWDTGGSDEFYRFQEVQMFSITRITEPNSGYISCWASYSAQLVAKPHIASKLFFEAGMGGAGVFESQLNIRMLGAQGQPLASLQSKPYHITCNQLDEPFFESWDFNPGLYDLVAGATWGVTGVQYVKRC
jgi:hypothetical protein